MEIWYMDHKKEAPVPFFELGISGVCLKHISLDESDGSFTAKRHFHTEYEIHLIVRGSQSYETEKGEITVRGGEAAIFAPHSKHRVMNTEFPLEKIAFTFSLSGTVIGVPVALSSAVGIPNTLVEFIREIGVERQNRRESSKHIVEARVLEALVRLLRVFGSNEKISASPESEEEPRLALARRYIKDNAVLGASVSDVARYCHVSERQLQRIFAAANDSVSGCIRKTKIKHAEELLANTSMPLSEIAERLAFGDEFYFNACFKRENGMTPGGYRRAFKKQ